MIVRYVRHHQQAHMVFPRALCVSVAGLYFLPAARRGRESTGQGWGRDRASYWSVPVVLCWDQIRSDGLFVVGMPCFFRNLLLVWAFSSFLPPCLSNAESCCQRNALAREAEGRSVKFFACFLGKDERDVRRSHNPFLQGAQNQRPTTTDTTRNAWCALLNPWAGGITMLCFLRAPEFHRLGERRRASPRPLQRTRHPSRLHPS